MTLNTDKAYRTSIVNKLRVLFHIELIHKIYTASGSAVMDAIAPSQTAFADLADGVLNYSVDAYFTAKGEVFSPLLITELLASYKIGDAAKPLPGNSEGMFALPTKTLAPGAIVVVANNKMIFNTLYPSI